MFCITLFLLFFCYFVIYTVLGPNIDDLYRIADCPSCPHEFVLCLCYRVLIEVTVWLGSIFGGDKLLERFKIFDMMSIKNVGQSASTFELDQLRRFFFNSF